jgi:isocitrate dehydrogenase
MDFSESVMAGLEASIGDGYAQAMLMEATHGTVRRHPAN